MKKLKTTSTNENLSLQQLETQCNKYAQTIETLNIEIDVLKSEILGKNDEISSIQNQYSQLGISYQTKLAEMEQNSQMSVEENILQLQSEINRLNQVLNEKENFTVEIKSNDGSNPLSTLLTQFMNSKQIVNSDTKNYQVNNTFDLDK